MRTAPGDARGADRVALTLQMLGLVLVLAVVGIVVAPALHDFTTLGGHDWDEMLAHRYFTIRSLVTYHQFPFWNPYACGGFDSWGNIQGDTNIVSPWFPAYLILPLRFAVRVEVVGAAVLGAMGAWLWAGRMTRSAALRAFVCVVFAVNGRWAMQTATGHAWHLYYAWMPWTFYFHDRAIGDSKYAPMHWRDVVACGACVAMMVYNGGIYPLPQTALVLFIYSVGLAVARLDPKPIVAGATAGIVGLGLSAPKLFPVLENISRFPRLVDSTEAIDLRAFVQLLIAPNQDVTSHPAATPIWGWHEYGMYIGAIAALAIFVAKLFARGPRERSLLVASVVALLLGFGAFHDDAPWTLLHKWVPIFKSQHVPTRWLYTWVLVAATLAASVGERALRRARGGRIAAEIGLLALVGFVGWDIAMSANLPMRHTFWMELPAVKESKGEYHQEARVPPELHYKVSDYAPPALPATMANVGVIECTLAAGINGWARDAKGHVAGAGAIGRGDPDYRGEAFTASGAGTARVVGFTPNAIVVEVEGATVGDVLALNQNWDPDWKVNGDRAINYADVVGAYIDRPNGRYEFRFRSHLFWVSTACGLLTIAIIAGGPRLMRRLRLRRGRSVAVPV